MGVWIETAHHHATSPPAMSHPVWVCGLKLVKNINSITTIMSHPVWVCGLKLHIGELQAAILSHTLYGCVD